MKLDVDKLLIALESNRHMIPEEALRSADRKAIQEACTRANSASSKGAVAHLAATIWAFTRRRPFGNYSMHVAAFVAETVGTRGYGIDFTATHSARDAIRAMALSAWRGDASEADVAKELRLVLPAHLEKARLN